MNYLADSEALYASIFNHSSDAIFLLQVGAQGQFIYKAVNPAYERALGKFKSEIVGTTPEAIFPAAIALQFTQRCRSCVRTGETIRYEETLLINQTKIWRTILVPIRNATGEIIRVQGSSRDITQEKIALTQQLQQTRYRNLLTSLALKIRQSLQIETILETTVIEVRQTLHADRVVFVRFLTNGAVQVIHESVASGLPKMQNQVITHDYQPHHHWRKYPQEYIHSCTDVTQEDYPPLYQKFLKRHQISAYLLVPIFISSPEHKVPANPNYLWGWLAIHQCFQPRKWLALEIELLQQLATQLDIALHQAQLLTREISHRQQLARSNADLAQFAYIASHDLQEPLQTISSYAKLLRKRYQGELDQKADNFIEHLWQSSQRMQTMIQDLLTYSQVGRSEEAFEWVNGNLILDKAIANLKHTIEKEQGCVTYEPLPSFFGDPSQLMQLWQNLLSNALKYRSQKPPQIQIKAQMQDNFWCFKITDNGIGIDHKYQKRIFQIFQRLHTQDEYSGNGIGLAICQRIVERHGGQIWLKSQLGEGTTFYFTINTQVNLPVI